MYNKLLRNSIKTLLTLSLAIASSANAGTQAGVVRYVSADRTTGAGVVTFDIASDQADNKPACAAASDKRWALNVGNSNAANQYIYSGIVAAMASGWRVSVVGTGSCTTVSYLEDVAYIEIRK